MASKYKILNDMNEKYGHPYGFEITCYEEAYEFHTMINDAVESGNSNFDPRDAETTLYAINNWSKLK